MSTQRKLCQKPYSKDRVSTSIPCQQQRKQVCLQKILGHLLIKSEARIAAFKRQQKMKMPKVMRKAVWQKGCSTRRPAGKYYVGSLLKACGLIKSLKIDGKEDFGEGFHTASTEPYYYNTAYKLGKIDYGSPIDDNGKCVVPNEILSEDVKKRRETPHEMGVLVIVSL